ncbi:MAG: 30S ribosomal protein S8 [bacterium]|nr:30S ribosomal protein S8 [bacterium]
MKGSYIDLLIRIKNGYMSGNEVITAQHSKFKEEILKVLKKLKFIEDYSVEKKGKPTLKVALAYDDGIGRMTDLKIYSKPGRKFYIKSTEIKYDKLSITNKVLTTSKGIMTDKEAKKNKLGGELLFEIW